MNWRRLAASAPKMGRRRLNPTMLGSASSVPILFPASSLPCLIWSPPSSNAERARRRHACWHATFNDWYAPSQNTPAHCEWRGGGSGPQPAGAMNLTCTAPWQTTGRLPLFRLCPCNTCLPTNRTLYARTKLLQHAFAVDGQIRLAAVVVDGEVVGGAVALGRAQAGQRRRADHEPELHCRDLARRDCGGAHGRKFPRTTTLLAKNFTTGCMPSLSTQLGGLDVRTREALAWCTVQLQRRRQ